MEIFRAASFRGNNVGSGLPVSKTRLVIGTLIVALIVAISGALALVYAGAYNVSARYPHPAPVGWLLHTTYQRSVAVRADGIAVPPLDRRQRVFAGARHFQETCQLCHTPPTQRPSAIARGLRPQPPPLPRMLAGNLGPAEAFWVIKHGLRMTGMPAFGPTHSDEDIWNLVAFLQRARGISEQDYRRLLSRVNSSGDGHHGGSRTGVPRRGSGAGHHPGQQPQRGHSH